MKLTKTLLLVAMTVMVSSVYAVQTDSEKNEATKKELKREANKAINRVEEAVCMEGDAECLKQKVEHRLEESSDAVKDKASEIKDKVDD